MRRRFWIILLSIGAIAGFAAGFARLHHYRHHGDWGYGHHWRGGHHAAFEQHVAELCTQAAGKVFESRAKGAEAPGSPGANP